jgi:hypothetical protein
MKTQKSEKRLFRTFRGHFHELMAVFERSAAHKLPGAKGVLREDAVARFISAWIPRRFSTPTNVFATTMAGSELAVELDMVVHDSHDGLVWGLDAQGGNSVATWEHIRLIVQVKSTLDEKEFNAACDAMRDVTSFAEGTGRSPPVCALFAYKVASDFQPFLIEKFVYQSSGSFPFDAFVLLDTGAYFSDSLRTLRIGIERGLGPELVLNDGPSRDKLILEDCMETRIPNGYRAVGDGSAESTLLAFASLATYASAGDEAIQALLSACMHRQYTPIFSDACSDENNYKYLRTDT